MLVKPIILIAALAAAAPAFAQDQAERDRMAAIRAQGEAERAQQELQRQQIEQQNQQRDLQLRLDALEAQQQARAVLLPQTIPNTPQAAAEQQRQNDIDARLLALERQRQASQPVATPAVPSLPAISPFTTPQPDYGTATSAQRQAAAEAYTTCLTRNARRLDDHISDAGTVAMAVNPACFAEFNTWKAIMEQGVSGGLKLSLDKALDAGEQSGGVQAVLQARSQARAAR